ncbi:MAG: M48 family metallopeptidase [candidate division Zixibacteria bacterium]|nr:M48 family metallopeptidase [candidate division Zixibacteria bacterium]
MRRLIRMAAPATLLAVIILAMSCATTGPGGQKSFILVSTEQEISIGQQMDQQVRGSEKILADTAWQNYVNDVGRKIVSTTERSDLPFQFAVIESDQVNAFATPGGYVYFYTGILRTCDKEAELVAVMAHEISHVVARHGVKRLQTVMGAEIVLSLALGGKSEMTQSLAETALGIVMQGYSRSQENEADNFGVTYMTRSGYDPNGTILMFEKLVQSGDGGTAGIFESLTSSHPDTQDRINKTKAEIAAMKPLPAGLSMDSQRYQQLRKRLPAAAKASATP